MSSAGSIQDMISKIKQLASLRKKDGFGVVAPKHRTNRNFNKDAVKVLNEEENAALRQSIARQQNKELQRNLLVFAFLLLLFLIGVYLLWNEFSNKKWFD